MRDLYTAAPWISGCAVHVAICIILPHNFRQCQPRWPGRSSHAICPHTITFTHTFCEFMRRPAGIETMDFGWGPPQSLIGHLGNVRCPSWHILEIAGNVALRLTLSHASLTKLFCAACTGAQLRAHGHRPACCNMKPQLLQRYACILLS